MASLLSDPWDGSDVAMILGVVLFCGACVVGTNLRVDLLHQWIDPRVKPTH
jgi:ABC-type dipeptide/oligopeptide/nickel transport system permease component